MASSNRSSKFASFVLGVVFGMGICAGAAYFLTTGPLPFVDKVDKVTAWIPTKSSIRVPTR